MSGSGQSNPEFSSSLTFASIRASLDLIKLRSTGIRVDKLVLQIKDVHGSSSSTVFAKARFFQGFSLPC